MKNLELLINITFTVYTTPKVTVGMENNEFVTMIYDLLQAGEFILMKDLGEVIMRMYDGNEFTFTLFIDKGDAYNNVYGVVVRGDGGSFGVFNSIFVREPFVVSEK